MEFKSVSIFLPAINETASLRKTFNIIAETCAPVDIEEIVIALCDKTTAETCKTAEAIMAIESALPVKIHYQDKSMPFIGGAMRDGFNIAKGSHLITMGTDLETDPYLVSAFIEKSKQFPGAIITASRWMKGGGFQGYNKVKLLLNFIFQKMLSVVYLTSLTDMTFCFQLFPTALVRSIEWEEFKHPFLLEATLKPLRLGTHFIEVPMQWKARSEGSSQNSFYKNFAYLRIFFRVRFMKKGKILKHGD